MEIKVYEKITTIEDQREFLLRAMSKYRASSNSRSRSAKLSGINRREFLMKFRMCLNMPPSLSMK